MIKNPLHPAAAQLLIDFYLSAEGQRGLAAAEKYRYAAVSKANRAKSIS